MEAISSNLVVLVPVVRNGIHIARFWHSLVPSSVDYCAVGNFWQNLLSSSDTSDVCGVVQWRKTLHSFKTLEYLIINNDRLRKAFTTVHNPVSTCFDFRYVFERPILLVGKRIHNPIYRFFMIFTALSLSKILFPFDFVSYV